VDIVETIIGQQLSNKVADVLASRFHALFPQPLQPQDVLHASVEQLRACGISYAKIAAIQGAAQAALDGSLELEHISHMTDDEIRDHLVQLRGVGEWTADMLLIFSLQRQDVFSVKDLGLRTAISRLYGIEREDTLAILTISGKWSPYRSLASRYLWMSLENETKTPDKEISE
jgi:DNA-3-methyladenine glycosylase II